DADVVAGPALGRVFEISCTAGGPDPGCERDRTRAIHPYLQDLLSARRRGVGAAVSHRAACIIAAALLMLTAGTDGLQAKPESRLEGRIIFITGESGDTGPTPRLIGLDADSTHRRVLLGWVYKAALSPNG